MTSRRSFIRQSALAAGGVLLSSSSFGNLFLAKKPHVIIIGAGLAGLSAAYKLRQHHVRATVLEAKGRVGGRVFSFPFDKDLVVELGGEWIGYGHDRIHELCAEMNLQLRNNQMNSHLIYKNEYKPYGKWDYSKEWTAKFEALIRAYRQIPEEQRPALFDGMDWWRYLVNNGCSGSDLDYRELADSTDFGESIRHVSAYMALEEYAANEDELKYGNGNASKNQMDEKIIGGNDLLPKHLAEKIGAANIRLHHKVTRIVQGGNKVKVHCDNGSVWEADKVICALPAFALKNIDWQPGLPERMMKAADALQYARINKHAIQFSNRFWKEESFDLVTDQLPHYFYHATQGQDAVKGVLISYSIGDKAAVIANQSREWNADALQQTLGPYFGNVKGMIERQENFYWGNNDYTKGAYALYGINQHDLSADLSAPFLHTFFAGEHIAAWQGFMEGAINSGEEAAGNILK